MYLIPSRSKTKCIYFCGRPGKVPYPPPVVLDGKVLPWVQELSHLGHLLHQTGKMDADANRARAIFISKSSDTRDTFHFADPSEQISLIRSLCCDGYGSMLWDFQSEHAEKYFRSWNTCVKMIWGIPRDTHTYLLENFFASNHYTLRQQILSRYPGFLRSLMYSPSKEVRILFRIIKNDPRSITCTNIRYLENKTEMHNLHQASPKMMKMKITKQPVPEKEAWRVTLLNSVYTRLSNNEISLEGLLEIDDFIASLCNS